MARIADVSTVLIRKIDPPQIEVLITSINEGNPYKKGERANLKTGLYCEEVIKKRHPLLVTDAMKDTEWNQNQEIERGMIYYLGFPLQWSDGNIFGTICILDSKNNPQATLYKDLISQFKEVIEGDLLIISEIAEQKQAQKKLSEQKDFFESIIETAQVIVLVLDPKGRIVRFNPYMEQISGYRLEEVQGKDCFTTFFAKQDEKRNRELFLKSNVVIHTRENINSVTLKDGSQREIEWRYKTLKNANDKVNGFLLVGKDVTKQKRIEEKLRESEARFSKAEEIAHIGSWEMNIDSGECELSDEFFRICGYKPQAFKPSVEKAFELIHSGDRKKARDAVNKTIKTGKPYDIIKRIVRPDKTVRLVHSIGKVEYDKDKRTKKIVGSFADITNRKKVEEELEKYRKHLEVLVEERTVALRKEINDRHIIEDELRKSKESLAQAQAIAHLGSWEWNISNNTMWWSNEMYKLFGLEPNQFVATYEAYLDFIHPEDLHAVKKSMKKASKKKSQYSIEHRIVLHHGDMRFVHERGEVSYDENGDTWRMIGTALDITDSKHAELLIRKNQVRLQSLMNLGLMKEASERELVEYALEEIVKLTESKIGYLHFVNPDQESVSLFAWSKAALANCTAESYQKYPLSKAGNWADCVREGKPVIHNNYSNLKAKKGLPDGHPTIKRHMSVPIYDRDKIVAIAGVGNKEMHYEETDAQQLELFVSSMWEILKRNQAEEELRIRTEELETFNKTMVDREIRIIEMKEEVNRLREELGRKPKYQPVWNDNKNVK
jgi:PAS domain S-box-containing protein